MPELVGAFARDYFAPVNLIVSVTGPLSHARALELAGLEWRDAGRHFAGLSVPAPPDAGPAPCLLDEPASLAGTAQSWVLLGEELSAAAAGSPEVAAATAYLSDRVAFAVREEEGLAYSIGAGLHAGEAPWWRVSFGTRPEKVERAVALTRAAVQAELNGAFDEAAFAASVQRHVSRLLMRRLPSDNRAFQAGVDELNGRPVGDATAWTERLAAVTPAAARAAAADVLHPDRWVAVVAP